MHRNQHHQFYFIAAFALLTVAGCSGEEPYVRVHGEVTYRGQPIKLGRILFQPDAGRGNLGPQGFAAIENGAFDTNSKNGRGSVRGPVLVKIEGYAEPPPGSDAWLGKALWAKPFEKSIEVSDDPTTMNFDVPAQP